MYVTYFVFSVAERSGLDNAFKNKSSDNKFRNCAIKVIGSIQKDVLAYGRTSGGKFALRIEVLMAVALGIISTFGFVGIINGYTMGLITIGTQGGMLLVHAGGKLLCAHEQNTLKDHKFAAIPIVGSAIFTMIIGSLGMAGAISTYSLSCFLLPAFLLVPILSVGSLLACTVGTCCCCCFCCCCCCNNFLEEEQMQQNSY